MFTIESVLLYIVLYTGVATIVQKKDLVPDSINISGPILTFRSQKGLGTIEKLANKFYKFWVPWGTSGVIAAILTGLVGLFFVGTSTYGILTQPETIAIQGPSDMLVIPGVNRFLPLSAAVEILLGLLIGMVVHEMGHAILCRVGNIDIKSTGVILGALIPLGAFVEPDEDSVENASAKNLLRMYAAGIMNNFAVFALSLVVLFSLVSLFISPIAGIGISTVMDDSPAERMGLEKGDVITGVDNETIQSEEEILSSLSEDSQTIEINENKNIDIEQSAYVTQVPDSIGLSPKDTIVTANGQDIKSPEDLSDKLREIDNYYTEVSLQNGDKKKIPVGSYVTSEKQIGITESMNLDKGQSTVVFNVENERVYDKETFISAINNTEGSFNITYLDSSGDVKTISTQLDEEDNPIIVSDNVSGINTSLLGIQIYPKEDFYTLLQPSSSIIGLLQSVFYIIMLPIASLAPGVEASFPGFTPFIQNFYEISGAPGWSESSIYFTFNVMFWSAWVNFNLALFNCLPTFALDGGHILNATTELLFGDRYSERIIYWINTTLKSLVLGSILVMFFIPLFV